MKVDLSLWDDALAAVERHGVIEQDLVSQVWCWPAQYVPVARKAGATPALFFREDMRCVWVVLAELPNTPVSEQFYWSKRLLVHEGEYNGVRPDAALIQLATRYARRSIQPVADTVRELLARHGEILKAQRLIHAARGNMSHAASALPLVESSPYIPRNKRRKESTKPVHPNRSGWRTTHASHLANS
jgi:hypothetical protein